MNTPSPLADEILESWFGDAADGRRDVPRSRRWFRGGAAFDGLLERRFGRRTVLDAAAGAYDGWQVTPAGALALIVLLDQFPRHLWRGRAEAFAHGERALAVAREGIARGDLERLPLVQRVFYCLPLVHAESSRCHREALALFRELLAEAPPELERFARSTLASAEEHAAIVERFGRYPHRNAALGRASTDAESAWLNDGRRRFGQ